MTVCNEGYGTRHIDDQLGYARPSTTMKYDLGRRAITAIDFADARETLLAGRPG
jgi:hypothetical protein